MNDLRRAHLPPEGLRLPIHAHDTAPPGGPAPPGDAPPVVLTGVVAGRRAEGRAGRLVEGTVGVPATVRAP